MYYLVLTIVIFTIILLSFRDWFKALCLLLPLLAILERPDMPREMFGIQGLNPFNICIAFILLGWILQKGKEGLRWQVPKDINRLFLLYVAIYLISFTRMLIDYESLSTFHITRGKEAPDISYLFINDFFNSIKWVLPGVLLCHGANSEERIKLATYAILATSILISLQIISRMSPALIGADDLASRALRVLDRNIGYHRVDLAALTAGASWGFLVARYFTQRKSTSLILLAGFFISSVSMALTGGRAGYLAWCVCGLFFAIIRWRKLLFVAPIVIVVAVPLIPGLYERLTLGFSEDSYSSYSQDQKGSVDLIDESGRDLYQITSGRALFWPIVIEAIMENPVFGYGMRATQKLNLSQKVLDETGFSFDVGHPHNAYLEIALDAGLIAAFIVLLFYFKLMLAAKNVFAKKDLPSYQIVTAGMLIAFTLAQLVAAIGSQSFHPKQGATLMWCSIGLFMAAIGKQINTPKAPSNGK